MSQNFASCGSQPKKYFGESVTPKNPIIQLKENTINVEYNGDHWYYKGAIVSLVKNCDKIVYKYDDTTNILLLYYDDGEEKFTIHLDRSKKINFIADTSVKSTLDSFVELPEEIKIKEINCKKAEEEKIINDHQKIMDEHKKIRDDHQKIIDEYHNEFKRKQAEENKIIDDHQKIIDDHQKIINEHYDKINKFNIEITEINDQNDFNDRFELLSKGIITYECFVAHSTTSDIEKLIARNCDQLKKLIIHKKFYINTKNKEGKTLLQITLGSYENFPIFLLENDIDISPSVKYDVKLNKSTFTNNAYFNNAKRNNHIDLLVTYRNDICNDHLKRLVDEHIKSTKK
jgi:hypothetical protein